MRLFEKINGGNRARFPTFKTWPSAKNALFPKIFKAEKFTGVNDFIIFLLNSSFVEKEMKLL